MRSRLKVIDGNILYLIGALIFFMIGFFLHIEDQRIVLVTIQLFVVLLPPIIYLKLKKINIKDALRLKKLRVKHGFLIGIITLLVYPVAMIGNLLMLTFLSLFGDIQPPEIPTAGNVKEYLILLLIVSIVAGICEEVFFRGFMLSAYERIGKTKAIIITAILFGVFHFNLYNLFGPIVLGLLFGYLVFLTNSIYAGIIGHVVNNAFAMTMAFLINTLSNQVPSLDAVAEPGVSITMALIMAFVFLTVFAVVTGFIAYLLVEVIRKDIKKETPELEKDENLLDEYPNEEVKETKFREYAPLILIIPLYIFIGIIQIKQLLGLV